MGVSCCCRAAKIILRELEAYVVLLLQEGVVPAGQSHRQPIAIHEIRIVLTIAEKSHDECRMLLVRRDGNHKAIPMHDTRAEVSMRHALPYLLRAG